MKKQRLKAGAMTAFQAEAVKFQVINQDRTLPPTSEATVNSILSIRFSSDQQLVPCKIYMPFLNPDFLPLAGEIIAAVIHPPYVVAGAVNKFDLKIIGRRFGFM